MSKLLTLGLVLGLAGLACGPANPRANVPFEACEMPAGGTYEGHWNTQPFGDMRLTQSGQAVTGSWEDRINHKTGRLEGTLQGCLVMFAWNETDDTIPGMPRVTDGHGVFRYILEPGQGEGAAIHRFEGTWGYDQDMQGGGTWTGRKLRE